MTDASLDTFGGPRRPATAGRLVRPQGAPSYAPGLAEVGVDEAHAVVVGAGEEDVAACRQRNAVAVLVGWFEDFYHSRYKAACKRQTAPSQAKSRAAEISCEDALKLGRFVLGGDAIRQMLEEAKTVGITVTGDRARTALFQSGSVSEDNEPVTFRKVDGAWLVES